MTIVYRKALNIRGFLWVFFVVVILIDKIDTIMMTKTKNTPYNTQAAD